MRFLTNAAVTVTDTYQYDAFGMPIAGNGTTANNFRYGGEWFDSGIGLYHLRARYYNQATGRFWARGPVEGKQCCGLSWNPYIYTRDNPVKFTDPTGRLLFEEGGSVQKWTAIIVGLTILGEVIREGFECSAEKAKSAVPVVTGPPENCFIKPHDDWPPTPVPEPDPLRWPEPWER